MYCIYGESHTSILIESTDSMIYCKATIFSELLNLVKLAMTHEPLNLFALNVRSKVTLYSSKSIYSKSQDAVVLFITMLN